jgi:hypothetical protein
MSSVVNCDARFFAVRKVPEESCRLDRLPDAMVAANMTAWLPDEDILALYRAYPDNPGIKKAKESVFYKESLREQIALEKGLEKLKTFARSGDLVEGMMWGAYGGLVTPYYGLLAAMILRNPTYRHMIARISAIPIYGPMVAKAYDLERILIERLARLSENALVEFGSKPVQALFSMAVAGAAARLISNRIAETHFNAGNRVILSVLPKVSLSMLAGILTIK